MNEDKIPMKPLNMKSKENTSGKHTHDTEQDQDRTNRAGKMSC